MGTEEVAAEENQKRTMEAKASAFQARCEECERARAPLAHMQELVADLHAQLEDLFGAMASSSVGTIVRPKHRTSACKASTPRNVGRGAAAQPTGNVGMR